METCPVCGNPWFVCSCTSRRIKEEAEEKDWNRDFGFNRDHAEQAERFVEERNQHMKQ